MINFDTFAIELETYLTSLGYEAVTLLKQRTFQRGKW